MFGERVFISGVNVVAVRIIIFYQFKIIISGDSTFSRFHGLSVKCYKDVID